MKELQAKNPRVDLKAACLGALQIYDQFVKQGAEQQV